MNSTRTSTTYHSLFAVSGFTRIAVGSQCALLGTQMVQGILVLFVLESFHSPQLAGLTVLLSSAPGLVISPVAGALLDRHGRNKLIVLDYTVAAFSLGSIVLLSAFHLLSPLVLLSIITISSLTRPLSLTGTRALLPTLVPMPLWDRANAVINGGEELSNVIGPSLAGVFVGWIGGQNTLAVPVALFILAALILIRLPAAPTREAQTSSVLREAWTAVGYIFTHRTLRGLVFTFLAGNIGYGVFVVGLPVLVLQRMGGSATLVGVAWAVMGGTSVVSVFIIGKVGTEGKERWAVAIGMVLFAIGALIVLLANRVEILLLGMVLIGLHSGPIGVSVSSLRQRRTPEKWMGRAFAVSLSLNAVGMPIGAALSGPLIARSVMVALGVTALSCIIASLLVLVTVPQEET